MFQLPEDGHRSGTGMTLVMAGAKECIDAGVGMVDGIFFLLSCKEEDMRSKFILVDIALSGRGCFGGGGL